jgi:hypothetical protein
MSEKDTSEKKQELPFQRNWTEAKSIRTDFRSQLAQFKESLNRLLYQLDGIEKDNENQIESIQNKLREQNKRTFDLSVPLATKKSATDLSQAQQLLTSFNHSNDLPMGIFVGADSEQTFQIGVSTCFSNLLEQSGNTFTGRDARSILSCILGLIKHPEDEPAAAAIGN